MKTCKGRMQMFSEGGAGGGALILYASLWGYMCQILELESGGD